jgi:hypothetical protein
MSVRPFGPAIAVGLVVVTLAATAALVTPASFRAHAQTTTAAPWEPARTPDGQPDIQGYWHYSFNSKDSYSFFTLEGLLVDQARAQFLTTRGVDRREPFPSAVTDPPDGKIPYQPWALARRNELIVLSQQPTKPEHVDPRAYCFLAGVPRQTYEAMAAGPHQIVQGAGYVVMVWEWAHSYRIIPLNGGPHVPASIKLWQGDSRGRWEGRTLVVETTNQRANWLDFIGDFHSDALHVVERFTFADADTIRYEATLEDAKVYTRPWKIALSLLREKEAGFELFESACYEGNMVDVPEIRPSPPPR